VIQVSLEPWYGVVSFDDSTSTAEDTHNNHGFRQAEVLPANTGHIRFDEFCQSEEAREAAAGAR